MKLFYMAGASSLAVHVVLEWVGATCDLVRMNRRSIKAPEYLKLDPGGTVPLLLDGDFSLTQSVAILGYVADLHPRARLLGDGTPRARAEVMRWLGFLTSDVTSAFKPIFSPDRYLRAPPGGGKSPPPPPEGVESTRERPFIDSREEGVADRVVETARHHVSGYLARLNSQLENREWLTGSRSIADAYLFVMLRWALGAKVGLGGFANLTAFVRRMHLDAGVHAALVLEEGLAPRPSEPASTLELPDNPLANARSLLKVSERIASGASVQIEGEVVGTVEYREGEGMSFELRRGIVQIDVSSTDTVFSWSDENCRGEAAIPFANFARYVTEGSLVLSL